MTTPTTDELQKLRGNLFAIELMLAQLFAARAAGSAQPEEELKALFRRIEEKALVADRELRHDERLTKEARASIESVRTLAAKLLPLTPR